MIHSARSADPGLPRPLGHALGLAARPFGQALVTALVNRGLTEQIEDGLVDFLTERTLEIHVTDLALRWTFTFRAGRIRATGVTAHPDAAIRADSVSLLLLVSRRADPDTLFFRRALSMEGDTELGVHVKNLLDTLEPERLPPGLARLLEESGRLAERLSG